MKNVIAYLSYLPKQIVLPFVLLAALLLPGAVFANHAPGSVPYTGASTQGADHAAFNIFSGDIPGVPSNAGEQDFVTVAPTGTLDWTNNLEICEGKFDVAIYLHNGAGVDENGANLDGDGVATGVRIKLTLPSGASMSHDLVGTITADNVAAIVDQATVHCDNHEIELDYVEGSAQIFRQSDGQFDPLSDDIVGPNGTLVGWETDNGVLPGCWEYRVIVKLTVEVKKVEKPTPIFDCTSLVADLTAIKKGDEVEFTAKAVAKDGATVTSYDFNFGDGEDETVVTDQLSASTTHTYDKVGTYNANVTVNFDVDGADKSDSGEKCAVTIKVTEDEPVCPTNPELPADHKDCKPPVTPPTESLPTTGPASVAAGFFGTSALFMSARSWLESRKMLLAGLLKKQ